jgi:hypothetical protein
MLKLNSSYSKKVPAEGEYSSQSYHASLELELSDSLSPEEIKTKIHNTFLLVKESVENELRGLNGGSRGSGSHDTPSRGAEGPDPASPRQLKFLGDMARRNGLSLEALLRKVGAASAADLTRKQCSALIDEVAGRKAA